MLTTFVRPMEDDLRFLRLKILVAECVTLENVVSGTKLWYEFLMADNLGCVPWALAFWIVVFLAH